MLICFYVLLSFSCIFQVFFIKHWFSCRSVRLPSHKSSSVFPGLFTVCLRGRLRFDCCCSNELHGYWPDTNDCGLYSNSHHWNLMQIPRRFKYVVRFLGGPGVSAGPLSQPRVWRSLPGLLVLHLLKAFCRRVWKSPCKSCYLAPAQEIWASAFNIFTIYGHMLYILCHGPNPSLLCCTTS